MERKLVSAMLFSLVVLLSGCGLFQQDGEPTLEPTQQSTASPAPATQTPEPTMPPIPTPIAEGPLDEILDPVEEGQPEVVIRELLTGDEGYVGEEQLVLVTATDAAGVARVDLLVDGVLRWTGTSPELVGRSDFDLVLSWVPDAPGEKELTVVAYRTNGVSSDPVTATVTILPRDEVQIEPTPAQCVARANTSLNVREGPSRYYERLTAINAGTEVLVTGRNEETTWWQVQVDGGRAGWISNAYTTLLGDCEAVELADLSALPTPIPTQAPPTPTAIPLLADLQIIRFDIPPTVTIRENGIVTVRISVTVINTGNTPATPSRVAIYPTGIGGPGGRIDVPLLSPVQPGESVQLAVDYTYTIPGVFNAAVVVDPSNRVTEYSEDNNTASTLVQVLRPEPISPGISLSIDQGAGTIQVSGTNFPAFSSVRVYLASLSGEQTSQAIGASTGEGGSFSIAFDVPDTWRDGSEIDVGRVSLVAATSDGAVRVTRTINYVRE